MSGKFNSKYWPTLDDHGSWLLYQVNRIKRGVVHPNGAIDVLEREYIGPQYISLLRHPDFPFTGQMYSTDPVNNVPPTALDSAALYEGLGPDGIGEIRNNIEGGMSHVPPILLLPDNTTPGHVVQGVSRCVGPQGPFNFPWTTRVIAKGAWGGYDDCVRTTLHEHNGDHFFNYVFAAGAPGQRRGLVWFWEGHKNPDGTFRGGLEYYALVAGHL